MLECASKIHFLINAGPARQGATNRAALLLSWNCFWEYNRANKLLWLYLGNSIILYLFFS